MNFILGDRAQYPLPSKKYKNAIQIKTVNPLTLLPNETKSIKSNMFIKHLPDYHYDYF